MSVNLNDYTHLNERIIITRFTLAVDHLCVIRVYTLEEGCDKDREMFHKELQKQ